MVFPSLLGFLIGCRTCSSCCMRGLAQNNNVLSSDSRFNGNGSRSCAAYFYNGLMNLVLSLPPIYYVGVGCVAVGVAWFHLARSPYAATGTSACAVMLPAHTWIALRRRHRERDRLKHGREQDIERPTRHKQNDTKIDRHKEKHTQGMISHPISSRCRSCPLAMAQSLIANMPASGVAPFVVFE